MLYITDISANFSRVWNPRKEIRVGKFRDAREIYSPSLSSPRELFHSILFFLSWENKPLEYM